MKSLTRITIALAALASCGDDKQKADASVHADAQRLDATPFPAMPTLGAQIDRMGRPAVTTALIALLSTVEADITLKNDNYNHGAVASAWTDLVLKGTVTTKLEFATNLAVLDVFDQGSGLPNAGCGNQALYNNMSVGGGTPVAASYHKLAEMLADDQLYLDTSKSSCTKYLAIELEVVGTFAHAQCGGRAPTHDIADVSYSLLTAGLAGFSTNGNLTPLITDGGVAVHTDVNDTTFPFLGAPTNL